MSKENRLLENVNSDKRKVGEVEHEIREKNAAVISEEICFLGSATTYTRLRIIIINSVVAKTIKRLKI